MAHLDNKKYLESILQSCDDEEDGGKIDFNIENIDVDMILNETDDFHVPLHKSPSEKSNEFLSNKKPSPIKDLPKNELKYEEKKIDLLAPLVNFIKKKSQTLFFFIK